MVNQNKPTKTNQLIINKINKPNQHYPVNNLKNNPNRKKKNPFLKPSVELHSIFMKSKTAICAGCFYQTIKGSYSNLTWRQFVAFKF